MNRPVYQAWQVGDTTYQEGYTYNSEEDGSLNTHHTATGQTLTMQYDGLRRLSGITGGIYGKTYTYRDISTTQTTTQVTSVVYDLPTDQSYGYTYDNMGNIATYTDANGTVTYTYDAQGQLLNATNGTTSYTYTYDTVGNILTANGHTYSYGNADWKDLLTAYDGEAITYDAIGNPLSYYNGTRWTFTWEDGRQLATATDGTTNVSYTYDSDGIRTSKTVNVVAHTYVYASGRLLRETFGDTTLDFFYSNSGQPYALSHNGTTYYYITNVQGDVMSIVDGTGAVVVSYEYDPYGNILSTTGTLADTLGEANPLRYRGYVYDQECDLYYLQSRYYDPGMGRFLNADVLASTGQGILGNNMFAYCGNNPVQRIDSSGNAYEEAPEGYRFVGAGVQLEVDMGNYTAGVEIIVYWDTRECKNGEAIIAVYTYSGGSVNFSDAYVGSITATIRDNMNLLTSGSQEDITKLVNIINGKYSASVSGVLLFGNEDFTTARSYEGLFWSVYGSICHLKGAAAVSSNCIAVAVGGTSSKTPSWGFSITNYVLRGTMRVAHSKSHTTV